MDATNTLKPMGTQSKETMDIEAAKAKDDVEGTLSAVNRTAEKVADKVDDIKEGASMAFDKASDVADVVEGTASAKLNAVKNQMRGGVASISDSIADYTEAEPLKAVLVAAATGAVLMALLSMMSSRD